MREILFRGKCVDTGIWYEGGYIHLHKTTHCCIGDPEQFSDNDIHQIVFERMTDWELPNQHLRVDVNPKTVGQFTGLFDKNGKKIFEGDIIDWDELEWGCPHRELVEWNYSQLSIREDDWGEWCKVIGNIHDNPELLEVDK